MENIQVIISKKLQIAYSNPRKEVSFPGKRSDVTVNYQNEDVHFEVFVTHDLDQEKIDIYKNNKIKCGRIDLSDPDWLTVPPEKIKDAVLNQHKNKITIYWEDESVQVKPEGISFGNIVLTAIAGLGLLYFFKSLFRRQNKR